MIKGYDLSKYTPMDKANLYWSEAVDSTLSDEQLKYLRAAFEQASIAGMMPFEFLISKTAELTIEQYNYARFNATGATNTIAPKKCTGGCDNCGAKKCQSKISVSVGEILENWGNANSEGFESDEASQQ